MSDNLREKYSIVNRLVAGGLKKKIFKPYIPVAVGAVLSLAALFQGGNPSEAVKRIKEKADWSFLLIGHNATIKETVPTKTDTLELKQVFGGSHFDQTGSIDINEQNKIISTIKNGLDSLVEKQIQHHLGGMMAVISKLTGEDATLTLNYDKPLITLDNITGLSSNDDSQGLNTDNSENIQLAIKRAEEIKKVIIDNIRSVVDSSKYDFHVEGLSVAGESVDYISSEIEKMEGLVGGVTDEERTKNMIKLIKQYNDGELSGESRKVLDDIIGSKRNVKITVTTNAHNKIEVFTFDYGLTIGYCMIFWFFLHYLPRMRKNGNIVMSILSLLNEGKSEEEVIKTITEKYNL